MEEFLTTKEIAGLLKVNVLTVRRWITSGKLQATDLGKEYRVTKVDFEQFLRERQTNEGAKK